MSASMARTILFLVSVVWGFSYVIIDAAVVVTPPFLFNFLRFALASVILFLVYAACGGSFRSFRRCALQGGVLGVLLFAAFTAQTFGFQTTTATNAGFLTGLGVVFVPIINRMIFAHSIDILKILAIVVSFFGLYFLTGVAESGFSSAVVGDWLIVLSAFFISLHMVFTGRFVSEHGAVEMMLWQTVIMIFMFLFSAVVFENYVWGNVGAYLGKVAVYAVVFTAVASTCFGYLAMTYMQKFVSSVQVALILTLEPVFTAAFDLAINDVRLTLLNAMGGGLILFAVVLSEFGAGLIPRIVVPNGKK